MRSNRKGTLMICSEWWAYEFHVMLAGLVGPTAQVELNDSATYLFMLGFCEHLHEHMLPLLYGSTVFLRKVMIWPLV